MAYIDLITLNQSSILVILLDYESYEIKVTTTQLGDCDVLSYLIGLDCNSSSPCITFPRCPHETRYRLNLGSAYPIVCWPHSLKLSQTFPIEGT